MTQQHDDATGRPDADTPAPAKRLSSARGRQDGDYAPPILAEPKGGPIPAHQPSTNG